MKKPTRLCYLSPSSQKLRSCYPAAKRRSELAWCLLANTCVAPCCIHGIAGQKENKRDKAEHSVS